MATYRFPCGRCGGTGNNPIPAVRRIHATDTKCETCGGEGTRVHSAAAFLVRVKTGELYGAYASRKAAERAKADILRHTIGRERAQLDREISLWD